MGDNEEQYGVYLNSLIKTWKALRANDFDPPRRQYSSDFKGANFWFVIGTHACIFVVSAELVYDADTDSSRDDWKYTLTL